MKRRAVILLALLALIFALAACNSNEDAEKAASDAVQASANAFIEGFDNHDLSQFDTFFAPPSDEYDMTQTHDAAHQLMDAAAPGESFQIDKLEIQNVRLDDKREEAVVTYQAQVSMWENDVMTFTAVVTQDIALQKIDGNWLITGGDAPQIDEGRGLE